MCGVRFSRVLKKIVNANGEIRSEFFISEEMRYNVFINALQVKNFRAVLFCLKKIKKTMIYSL